MIFIFRKNIDIYKLKFNKILFEPFLFDFIIANLDNISLNIIHEARYLIWWNYFKFRIFYDNFQVLTLIQLLLNNLKNKNNYIIFNILINNIELLNLVRKNFLKLYQKNDILNMLLNNIDYDFTIIYKPTNIFTYNYKLLKKNKKKLHENLYIELYKPYRINAFLQNGYDVEEIYN